MPLNRTPPAGKPSRRVVRPPWAVENDAGLRTRDAAGLARSPQPLDNMASPATKLGQPGTGRRAVQPPPSEGSQPSPSRPTVQDLRRGGGGGGQQQQQQQRQQRGRESSAVPSKRRTAEAAALSTATEAATIKPQKLYVGDRAKIRGTPRVGEVMYVGPADFAHGKTVVGLKLNHKRTTSMCDGKYHGERYFRCQPGYGQYVPLSDAEVLEDDPLYMQPTPVATPAVPSPPPTAPTPTPFTIATPSAGSAAGSGGSRRHSRDGGGSSPLDHELRELVGLSKVKHTLNSIRNSIVMQRKRAAFGPPQTPMMPMHAVNVFLGNAGTGKSTVAGVMARLLKSMGACERAEVLEVERKDLTSSGYHEDDDPCVAVVRAARGGVLLVNDAHKLVDDKSRDSSGHKAVHTLAKECSAGRKFVLVLCGPRAPMETFLRGPGAPLARLVTNTMDFPDLSAEECAQVTRVVARAKGFSLGPELTDGVLAEVFRARLRRLDAQSSSGLAVHSILMDAIRAQTDRTHQKGTVSKTSLTTLLEEDFRQDGAGAGGASAAGGGGADDVSSVLARLDGVIGLAGVKTFVRSMVATLELDRQRREVGMKPLNDATHHMIFAGNPGTGKTTIARVVADMLRTLGVLRIGHLVEADRSSLVAGYVGQTALKTQQVVQSALGGVLFIDEAYSLVSNEKDTFGREALDSLIKLVEDFRDDVVVILAGCALPPSLPPSLRVWRARMTMCVCDSSLGTRTRWTSCFLITRACDRDSPQ
jgi:adenylylsulfate kinase-like enzyme